jgi:hypothetical protein
VKHLKNQAKVEFGHLCCEVGIKPSPQEAVGNLLVGYHPL